MTWRERLARWRLWLGFGPAAAGGEVLTGPCHCPYRCRRHPLLYDIHGQARANRREYVGESWVSPDKVQEYGHRFLVGRATDFDWMRTLPGRVEIRRPLADISIDRDGTMTPHTETGRRVVRSCARPDEPYDWAEDGL